MKSRSVLALAAMILLAAAARAQTPTFVPAGDVKWVDLDPAGAPGVKIADLWGDHATGAYGAFLKLPAGFAAPLHTHTNAIKIVVVSGTYLQAPAGKPQMRLEPGSYELQPGGGYQHTSGCDKASGDCVLFIESDGKFDLMMVEAPKAPGAK